MYTEETKAVLEALQENKKVLEKQRKQMDKIFSKWNQSFKKLLDRY